MEIIDLYDRQKRKLNKTFDRWSGEPVEGEYKQTVHIWFLNSKGELLVQKRSMTRTRNPGKWAFTGGAVDTGETSLQSAIREVEEELGLKFLEEELDFIISFKREHVFVDVWLIRADIDINEIKMQEEEVEEVKWVSLSELTEMIRKDEFVKSTKLYYELFIRILENCYDVKL